MPKEIERKYLVKAHLLALPEQGDYIHQGYLASAPERSVRIRIKNHQAYITLKGITVDATRTEFEYPIPEEDGRIILQELCERPTIEKIRYNIPYKGFLWEVDVFSGENEGLIIAEIELEYAGQKFPLPEWIGNEVTHDNRYYNVNLVAHPYNSW